MQIFGGLFLLLMACSVFELYKRVLEFFLGYILMDCITCLNYLALNSDFACGFLVLGSFKPVFQVLGLFLLFAFGLKLLQFHWPCKSLVQFLCDYRCKLGEFGHGFHSKTVVGSKCSSKIASCQSMLVKFSKNSNSPLVDKEMEEKQENVNGNGKLNNDSDAESNDEGDEKECYSEDELFDVVTLRKMIKIDRKRANAAYQELEKERAAAATAAEEAMAMILRLQNEKSLIEMEAKQYRRLAEEKQLHDQEVIQSLQWLVLRHESERSVLEDQLTMSRRKLKQFMKCDETNQCEGGLDGLRSFNGNIQDALEDVLYSSLDMNVSP